MLALYSTHVVRLVAPPHLTKNLGEEVLPDLQHLLLHARLHLTLLVHLLNRSPHLRHILLLLLILFPILWWLIRRAGAPTVPAPASTLAPDSARATRCGAAIALRAAQGVNSIFHSFFKPFYLFGGITIGRVPLYGKVTLRVLLCLW